MNKDGFSFSTENINVDQKITIVASKWNAELVQELIKSGSAHLEALGISNFKIVSDFNNLFEKL